MNASITTQREELLHYIEIVEDKKIKAFYTMLETDIKEKTEKYTLSEAQIEEADKRTQSYLAGKSKAYNWEEAKKMITSKV